MNTAVSKFLLDPEGFRKPTYETVKAGHYTDTYENLHADIVCDSLQKREFEARIFSFRELKLGRIKKKIDRGGLIQNLIRPAIETADHSKPWECVSVSQLLAYEAAHINQHEYPLLGLGLFYTHSLGRVDMAEFNPVGMPAITIEKGVRRVSFLALEGATFDELSDTSMLKTGHFLAIR